MMLVETPRMMDHGKQEISCVWIPDHGSWQELTICNEHPQHGQPNPSPVIDHKFKDDSLCSQNLESSSQLSTEVNMSETTMPNFVYKRRTIQNNDVLVLPVSRSSKSTLVYTRRKALTVSDNKPSLDSRSGSIGDDLTIKEPESKMRKFSADSCSSSKSNMDDIGECSSSGVLITGSFRKDISETISCLSFLRHHRKLPEGRSKKPKGVLMDICSLRACKVCGRSTTSLKMIICDLCEEAFHTTCCNPALKKVPIGDWFCRSCLQKKVKKTETNSRKSNMDYSGSIASMLRDVGPFASNVRIGKDFQAEVPDWSGPLTKELDDYSEPTETSPLECTSYQDWDSSKLLRLSSIGNWLQCREVVDKVNGNICGKWRRAPLFEVQTDDWECFSSVLWDQTHADCAVPQELDTAQVLKQLKYIEMLRPRLSAKRWKLGVQKGIDREEHTGDPRNTQKS